MQYGYFFFLTAFLGFLWEVSFTLFSRGSLCKRGFFYGPWLPVYGTGGVLLYLLLHRIRKRYLLCFLLSMVIGTAIELTIGLFTAQVYHLRYWNYSGYPYNFMGQICLYSSLGFGLAGVLWVSFLSRYALLLWQRLGSKRQQELMLMLLLLFFIDCMIALPAPNTGRGITF